MIGKIDKPLYTDHNRAPRRSILIKGHEDERENKRMGNVARGYTPPSNKLGILFSFLGNVLGPNVERRLRNSIQPPPVREPVGFGLDGGINLWMLPVGHVMIRQRHMELEKKLEETDYTRRNDYD